MLQSLFGRNSLCWVINEHPERKKKSISYHIHKLHIPGLFQKGEKAIPKTFISVYCRQLAHSSDRHTSVTVNDGTACVYLYQLDQKAETCGSMRTTYLYILVYLAGVFIHQLVQDAVSLVSVLFSWCKSTHAVTVLSKYSIIGGPRRVYPIQIPKQSLKFQSLLL